jgi:hypothetical protein
MMGEPFFMARSVSGFQKVQTPGRLFVFSALMAGLAVAAWSWIATHYTPEIGHLRVGVWWAVIVFFFSYGACIQITLVARRPPRNSGTQE